MQKIMLICLLMAYSIGIFAEGSIGTVLVAINHVIAKQATKERTLSRGSDIYVKETIITGAADQAQIKYTSGTLVAIKPNSQYETVAYNEKQPETFKANLSLGSIDYKSKGKKQGVLKTPVVALAILGTDFTALVTPSSTEVTVREGMVSMDGHIIGSGQSGTVDSSGHFTPSATSISASASADTAAPDGMTGMIMAAVSTLGVDLIANTSLTSGDVMQSIPFPLPISTPGC